MGQDGPISILWARWIGDQFCPLHCLSCSSCLWNRGTNKGAENRNKTAKVSIILYVWNLLRSCL